MSARIPDLVLKRRYGHSVSRLDKIATLECLDEVSGFKWGVAEFGPPLTSAETSALAHHAIAIQRGGR